MKHTDTEQLRRQMEHAALLPPDDASRQALVKQLATVDGRAEQRWLDVLEENERLRLELSRVEVPPGLQQRLNDIPRQHPQPHTRRFSGWTRWITAAAAVLVMMVTLFAFDAYREHRQRRTIQTFATLVTAHHQAMPELSVRAAQWEVVEAALKDEVPFPIRKPDRTPELALAGGRAAVLAGAPLLYTRWEHDGQICSLYQFCAGDFGLRRPLDRTQISPQSVPLSPGVTVIIWSEDHCDYALVMESATTSNPWNRV